MIERCIIETDFSFKSFRRGLLLIVYKGGTQIIFHVANINY